MPKKSISKKNKITSKDVAALAGVSQSTVSRVLSLSDNAKGFISEETSKRVREAANKLGYSPNPIARALRGHSTNLIGLVVREIADPFFAGFIEALSVKVRESGFSMVLAHVHSDPDEALEMTHVLDTRQCDGVIFLGDLRNDEKVIQTILMENRPVVALSRGRSVSSLPTVNVNNAEGIHLLVDYLVEQGHQQIIFVDGGWFGDIHERREVFMNYKGRINSEVNLSWIQGKDNSPAGGYTAMVEISKMSQRPTAIMASDDAMATGILKAAADLNISVPEEISVTGFDDIGFAKYLVPSLTTVRQPIEEMSRIALEYIKKQISGEKIPYEGNLINVMPELIIRDSTGPCKK